MTFSLLINIFIWILFTISILFTVWILFIFISKIKANVCLNKSVSKSVFKGKTSLTIILIFFGITFGLIGGMNLVSKNGERTIERQFNRNNVYEIETPSHDNNYLTSDGLRTMDVQRYIKKYNLKSSPDILMVNTSLIRNTISPSTRNHFNNSKNFNEIKLSDEEYISPDNVFGSSVEDTLGIYSNYKHKDLWGWTHDNWIEALEYDIKKQTEEWDNLNTLVGGAKWTNHSFADAFIEKLFGGNYNQFGYLKDFITVFSSANIPELSYKISSYQNTTPLLMENRDFEIIVVNDIDFRNGCSLGGDGEKDYFVHGKDDVNKTEYVESKEGIEKGIRGLREQSNLLKKPQNSLFQNYYVNVQEDYLKLNNLKPGDLIKFNESTNFIVSSSVRFSEITYPAMGANVVPDKAKQAFIQMNLSDYLKFSTNNTYTSLTNENLKGYIKIRNKDWSINDWISETSKQEKNYEMFLSYVDKINDAKSINYEIDKETLYEKMDTLDQEGINTKTFRDKVKEFDLIRDGQYKDDNVLGKRFSTISSFNSFLSPRALLGPENIKSVNGLLSVLKIIFMSVVLLVLSLLISKRITSSEKQIGTLKAMGMKNNSIATSYTLYPVIIVAIGFIFALFISPIVMFLFKGIMTKYFYALFSSQALSMSFFLSTLFIPMILSIVLAYLIALKTLRKPTLDLLNNKHKDSPNILVRSAGYITPKKTPFAVSYMGKGLLKSIGKSSILFLSIFLASILTSFAMSSSTMISTQTNNILSYLNIDSFEVGNLSNSGQYNVKKLYDEKSGELAYKNDLIRVGGTKDEVEEITALENHYGTFSGNLANYYKTDGEYSFNDLYDDTTDNALSFQENNIEESLFTINIDGNIDSGKVVSKYIVEEMFVTNILLEGAFPAEGLDGETTFTNWQEKEHKDKLNYVNLSFIMENWLKTMLMSTTPDTTSSLLEKGLNFSDVIEGNKLTVNTVEDIVKMYRNRERDVAFGTYYYNQYYQSTFSNMNIYSRDNAINSTKYKEYHEKIYNGSIDRHKSNMYVANSKEDFLNVWGNINNNKGEKLWASSFEKYYDKDGNLKNEKLDYIPVISSTQTINFLDEMVENKYATHEGDGVYMISLDLSTKHTNIINTQTTPNSIRNLPIQIKVKVENSLFLGIDFGLNTIEPFVTKYLESYVFEPISGQLEQKEEYLKWINPLEGNYVERQVLPSTNIIFKEGSSPNTAFKFQPETIFNIRNSKNLPNSSKMNSLSTSTLALPISQYNKIQQDQSAGTKIFNLESLIDPPTNPPSITSSNLSSTSGVSIRLETFLSQGSKVYAVITSIFKLISIFSLFISTTIIIIAMKDVIDSSKREVSMLKAFGYSNLRATALILSPYLIIIAIAFLISIPLTFAGLSIFQIFLTNATGNTFIFVLTISQWLTLTTYIFSLTGIIMLLAFIAFRRTNSLEAIKSTEE